MPYSDVISSREILPGGTIVPLGPFDEICQRLYDQTLLLLLIETIISSSQCLDAALHLYKRVCLLVCRLVGPSVGGSKTYYFQIIKRVFLFIYISPETLQECSIKSLHQAQKHYKRLVLRVQQQKQKCIFITKKQVSNM